MVTYSPDELAEKLISEHSGDAGKTPKQTARKIRGFLREHKAEGLGIQEAPHKPWKIPDTSVDVIQAEFERWVEE